VIVVLDEDRAEADLAAGVIGCPRCAGSLRPWSWASARRIRRLDGATLLIRPRRGRCTSCGSTQVLLPASCQPRRADATEVIGAALVAKAQGRGYRTIARDLDRPPATVRRWLRRVRGPHTGWLRRRGTDHSARLDAEMLNGILAQPTELGDALAALAAAVRAHRRRFAPCADAWSLIGVFTAGRLLLPSPNG
jgi:Domain of unknown function (DUF6431)/Homeodomain-like domain